MADDDPTYTNRQRDHAQEVRDVSKIQKAYGVSYSQARAALHQARAEATYQAYSRAVQLRSDPPPPPPAPFVKTTETKLEPAKVVFNAPAPVAPVGGTDSGLIANGQVSLSYCDTSGDTPTMVTVTVLTL